MPAHLSNVSEIALFDILISTFSALLSVAVFVLPSTTLNSHVSKPKIRASRDFFIAAQRSLERITLTYPKWVRHVLNMSLVRHHRILRKIRREWQLASRKSFHWFHAPHDFTLVMRRTSDSDRRCAAVMSRTYSTHAVNEVTAV
jgi:hypothetical protein